MRARPQTWARSVEAAGAMKEVPRPENGQCRRQWYYARSFPGDIIKLTVQKWRENFVLNHRGNKCIRKR